MELYSTPAVCFMTLRGIPFPFLQFFEPLTTWSNVPAQNTSGCLSLRQERFPCLQEPATGANVIQSRIILSLPFLRAILILSFICGDLRVGFSSSAPAFETLHRYEFVIALALAICVLQLFLILSFRRF